MKHLHLETILNGLTVGTFLQTLAFYLLLFLLFQVLLSQLNLWPLRLRTLLSSKKLFPAKTALPD